jgi:hypothetical protein
MHDYPVHSLAACLQTLHINYYKYRIREYKIYSTKCRSLKLATFYFFFL